MSNIHIAGTGIWYPDDKVTNEEIVTSFNAYVDNFNIDNASEISKGHLEPMEHSSVDFIEQASGIQTRYVIDKEGILNPKKMMPSLQNEDESLISLHAQKGVIAAQKAIEQAEISVNDIDAVIVGSSHAARNYPAVAIEIQHELGINGYAYDMKDLCEYYKMYRDLMGFWHSKYPGKIYDLNYDLLVKNPPKEIKSLINWLGWEWNASYLSPDLNDRAVYTASDIQVRSPINTKSIGGWKNYKEMLRPAIEIFTKKDKYKDLKY